MKSTDKESNFLELHKKSIEIGGFWQEEYRSSILGSLEMRYKTKVVREWQIVDFVSNGGKVLVKWQKRLLPLTDEEIKKNLRAINHEHTQLLPNRQLDLRILTKSISMKPELTFTDEEKAGVLKRFMQEFFPFTQFKKIGLFTKEMKGDYGAQATRVCEFFDYKTVYEYGADELRCHLSSFNPEPNEPFVTVIASIYD